MDFYDLLDTDKKFRDEFFAHALSSLRQLSDAIKQAKTAQTKKEAEVFIKELTILAYRTGSIFSADKENFERISIEAMKNKIRNRLGDYGTLTDLYKQLGAI